MGLSFPPPPKSSSNFEHLKSPSSLQGHGNNWQPGPNKIKNSMGGHYGGYHAPANSVKIPQQEAEDDVGPDAPVKSLVDNQFRSMGIHPISSKKSDAQEWEPLQEAVPEEGEKLEKEHSSHHHRDNLSNHFAAQSAKISDRFEHYR